MVDTSQATSADHFRMFCFVRLIYFHLSISLDRTLSSLFTHLFAFGTFGLSAAYRTGEAASVSEMRTKKDCAILPAH